MLLKETFEKVINENFKKPLHVVFAKNDEDTIIITAYRPDKLKWTNNYQIYLVKSSIFTFV